MKSTTAAENLYSVTHHSPNVIAAPPVAVCCCCMFWMWARVWLWSSLDCSKRLWCRLLEQQERMSGRDTERQRRVCACVYKCAARTKGAFLDSLLLANHGWLWIYTRKSYTANMPIPFTQWKQQEETIKNGKKIYFPLSFILAWIFFYTHSLCACLVCLPTDGVPYLHDDRFS